jgi:glycosyltransferase involved in cell wall biosynthesis
MPPLRLSVILPTFNRVAALRHAMSSLLGQDAPADAYEVIVVDNNCNDGTAELLELIADRRVRCLREPRQGLSYARNAGIAVARGDLIAFTDDDVEVARDWIRRIISTLDARPDVDGVGGRVLPEWHSRHPAWLTSAHWGPLALQDHGDRVRLFDRHLPLGLIGANLALRAAVFARVGQFSPDVQRVGDSIGSTEDHDLMHRLYASGGSMLYDPGILVLARVQPDRCARAYHRRWHQGHGRFHALMRLPEIEQTCTTVAGVPAHLVRTAASDAGVWVASMLSGRWDDAFRAELRLRFFAGFTRTRLGK